MPRKLRVENRPLRTAMWILASAVALPLTTGQPAWSCTTAVISGKATADGRPILWKNRDSPSTKNEVVHITDGKYALTALVNAGSRSSVWMGVNEAGLCIENSVTSDLAHPKDAKGVGNGGFMLLALRTCATVDDVKKLLEETDATGRSTCANFGVIDAQGGAVLFETSRNAHKAFDANDPAVAPQGVVVRSNFSMTGRSFAEPPTAEQLTDIYSGERYLRASQLIDAANGRLDARYIFRNCARDLADADCQPYCGSINGAAGELPEFIGTKNTICRSTTVSIAVFQGVRPGEDPLLTTMWLGVGDPKFSVVVPCWVATADVAEELKGDDGAPICLAAIALRAKFFDKEDNGVHTEGLQEIWGELWPVEDELFERVQARLAEWRSNGINSASMKAIHVSAAEQALAAVKQQLQRVPAGKVPTAAQQ